MSHVPVLQGVHYDGDTGAGPIIRSQPMGGECGVSVILNTDFISNSGLRRGAADTRANSSLLWARDKDNNLPVMIRINGLMSFFWISSPFTRGIYIMTSLDKIIVTTHQNSNNLPSARVINLETKPYL